VRGSNLALTGILEVDRSKSRSVSTTRTVEGHVRKLELGRERQPLRSTPSTGQRARVRVVRSRGLCEVDKEELVGVLEKPARRRIARIKDGVLAGRIDDQRGSRTRQFVASRSIRTIGIEDGQGRALVRGPQAHGLPLRNHEDPFPVERRRGRDDASERNGGDPRV
jgi:hypothetical protein